MRVPTNVISVPEDPSSLTLIASPAFPPLAISLAARCMIYASLENTASVAIGADLDAMRTNSAEMSLFRHF